MAAGPGVINGVHVSGTTAQRPTNASLGCTYYDTTLDQLMVYGDSGWQGASIQHVDFVYGEATPLDAPFFVADRAYTVKSIRVRPLVVGSDGGAVTLAVKKAPSGTAVASGTALHSSTADLKGTVNANQSLTLSTTAADLAIAAGDCIGVDVTGTTTAARGVVTVALVAA